MAAVAEVAEEVDGEDEVLQQPERPFHADDPVRLVDRPAQQPEPPVRRDPRRLEDLQRLPVAGRVPAAEAGVRHPLPAESVPEPPALGEVDVVVPAQQVVRLGVAVAAHRRGVSAPRERGVRPDGRLDGAERVQVYPERRALRGIRPGVPDVAAADVRRLDVGRGAERQPPAELPGEGGRVASLGLRARARRQCGRQYQCCCCLHGLSPSARPRFSAGRPRTPPSGSRT